MPAIVVYKIGGSLLDLPDLPRRLRRVVPPDVFPLFVVGGGRTANLVREWDRLHHLGEERGHWLALRAMQLNESLLENVLPDASVVETRDAAIAEWGRGWWPIISAFDFLTAEEPLAKTPLPHYWDATSDSVAAWISSRWPAERLVLLKSVELPQIDGRRREAATTGHGFTDTGTGNAASELVAAGLVDRCFPALARDLPAVEWINLRDERPVSQRICFAPHSSPRETSARPTR